jgi:hypothetical protein
MSRKGLSGLALLGLLIACVQPAAAATHFVGTCGNPQSVTIMGAVSVAAPGDTIKICPGVYREQVIISKSLTLMGVNVGNAGLVEITPSASPQTTTSTVNGTALLPTMWVSDATVNISNVVLGGSTLFQRCQQSNPSLLNVGVYYTGGSSGTLNNVISRSQCGAAVWLENSSNTGGSFTVENSIFTSDFYGIFAAGGTHQIGTMPLLRATITNNDINHYFHGIYMDDIGGTVSNNIVTGMTVNIQSVGISDSAPDALVTNNKILNDQTGIEALVAGVNITSNRIDGALGDIATTGINLHCFSANVTGNTIFAFGGSTSSLSQGTGINNAPPDFAGTNTFHDTNLLLRTGGCQ